MNKIDSLIGSNTSYKGDTKINGTLKIEGAMEGEVRADWVFLGKSARVVGRVIAKGVIVAGRIKGSVRAEQRVEIRSGAGINGDITTSRLVVEEGGLINGLVSMSEQSVKVIELQPENKSASSSEAPSESQPE